MVDNAKLCQRSGKRDTGVSERIFLPFYGYVKLLLLQPEMLLLEDIVDLALLHATTLY